MMKSELSTLLHTYLEALDDDLEQMDDKIKQLSIKIRDDFAALEKIIQPSSMARLDVLKDDVKTLELHRDALRVKLEYLFDQTEIENFSELSGAFETRMPVIHQRIEDSDDFRTAIIEIEEEQHQGGPTGIFNFIKSMFWKESPAEHIEQHQNHSPASNSNDATHPAEPTNNSKN